MTQDMIPDIEMPESIFVNLTDDCFFRCKMCFKWKPDIHNPKGSSAMKTEILLERLKKMSRAAKGIPIYFAGGEPLLRHDTPEIISECTRIGFKTRLTTNGWLIDDKMAETLAGSGLDMISISLDGSENTHDSIRGKKRSYAKVMSAIRSLSDRGIRVALQFVVMEDNYRELPEMIGFADRSDEIISLHINALSPPNNHPYSPWLA
jgi:MoaA/NifB/PqqE/SkfB family radical SAM enzyme